MALNIVVIHSFGDLISRLGVGVLSDSLSMGHAALFATIARSLGIDAMREHLTAALLVVPLGLFCFGFLFSLGSEKARRVIAIPISNLKAQI